jgi:TrmH family RNA methyltransferase
MILIDEKSFFDEELVLKAESNNIPVQKITTKLLEKLSDTETPQGIIGIVHMKKQTQFDYNNMKLIIALDSINDPGNLGTITRTAYWYGVEGILLGERSVDIYNPKVIRSSQRRFPCQFN